MNRSTAMKRQRHHVLALQLVALVLLALFAYVRTLSATKGAIPLADEPEALWWGLWPITYLPAWFFILGSLAIITLVVTSWWIELTDVRPRLPKLTFGQRWNLLALISALLLIAFFAFPIVHTRWGDAYIISRSLVWPTEEFRLTHTWQAPLDVFLHSQVWRLVSPYVAIDDATPIYRLLSPMAGAIFLGALFMLSRNRRFAPDWLTYGLIVTLGVIQLFFGYIENYSFAAAFVLVYLWLAIRCALDEGALWPAVLALALANAFHPSTIVLIPSLAVLVWLQLQSPNVDNNDVAGNQQWRSIVIQVVLPITIVYGLTWLMMELGQHGIATLFTVDKPGGGDARWLVPLRAATTDWEHYTMFSWPHMRDFINEQLLVGPVVLPSLVITAVAALARRKKDSDGRAGQVESPDARQDRAVLYVLLIASFFYLLLVWLWNPDYGGQRDWDLFSLSLLPLTALLVFLLSRTLGTHRYLLMGAMPLIAVQALHTLAWVYQNTLPWTWP